METSEAPGRVSPESESTREEYASGIAAPPPTREATRPAPDEDELDDLDDMLDEFSSSSLHPKPEASGPGRPADVPTVEKESHMTNAEQDEFRNALQKEMESLVSEIDESPEVRKQFESLLSSIAAEGSKDASGAASTGESADEKNAPVGAEDNFQETIRKTMDRMKASSALATAASKSARVNPEDDILASMLKDLQPEGGEEDFSKMLLGMMEQLTNKDILYEPMKELNEKFPGWMEREGPKQKPEDLERYKVQESVVKEIVGRYERPGYSDENSEDREFIVERMQKMQAAGSPPPDIVGDMKEAQEVIGELDQGCPQQ